MSTEDETGVNNVDRLRFECHICKDGTPERLMLYIHFSGARDADEEPHDFVNTDHRARFRYLPGSRAVYDERTFCTLLRLALIRDEGSARASTATDFIGRRTWESVRRTSYRETLDRIVGGNGPLVLWCGTGARIRATIRVRIEPAEQLAIIHAWLNRPDTNKSADVADAPEGERQDHEDMVMPIDARITNESAVRDKLVKALDISFHEHSDWKQEVDACYARMIGIGYSVIQAARLIDECALGQYDEASTHLVHRVLSSPATMTEEERRHTAAWAIGYYLGNAQARVGAAFNGLVNTLLIRTHPARELLQKPPRVRVTLLSKSKALSPPLRDAIKGFIEPFTAFYTSDAADRHIENTITETHFPNLAVALAHTMTSEHLCVALCCARADAFREKPQGTGFTRINRMPYTRPVQLVWCVRAVRCLAHVLELAAAPDGALSITRPKIKKPH